MAKRRIVLIGYRGTGKSSIGKALSRMTGQGYLDTDQLIEDATGKKISQIFESEGEAGFREIEQHVIARIPSGAGIISTGGGAVIRPVNVRMLRMNSLVILLNSSPEVIYNRIHASDRPSLTGLPLREEIEQVLKERMPIYRSVADIVIDTSTTTPEEAARQILNLVENGICVPDKRKELFASVMKTAIPSGEKIHLKKISGDYDIFLYGILGYPCLHSKSPGIYNHLFADYGMPAHYTWFEHKDPGRFLSLLPGTGVRGLSVTIPHKETVIPYLDEIKHDAESIGAVNTILIQDEKKYGFNTDWKGIYRPLEGTLGDTAVILGAGGAAAAAVYAVSMRGFTPVILNRTPERAEHLARKSGAEIGSLGDIGKYHPDLIINATPVGMGSDPHTPIPPSALQPGMKVFDLVYTPRDTPLLQAALASGCSVIPGTEMFIHQLAEQFRILTGIDTPVSRLREILA
ncbi:shikimate dehydrogenase [Methanospirillum hungatei]|mgnify:CR=1 FL=1|jgi:shikimate kinase|uniref:shikimate dehydrogenase n=1 Tax=Methanospirillum hungatei TaxID=2203 RepID=UPI0009D4B1A3|nr:shikimate dehydrogenase [Methanospirillum hungatei]MBP9008178.1 shikimate dehydrogenase [Methanospirillum sp.]OQA60364.1 MAG: Shikimate dehydrogenase [Euryarchaeota archaeon ADurb.Bin294]HOW05130.1 shikimate dehydrogenase [Methanospirillum hungatei]